MARGAQGSSVQKHAVQLLRSLWIYHGVIDRIHHALYVQCRERLEREASPTAYIIDS